MEDRRRYRFRIWHPAEKKMMPVISMTRGGIVAQDADATQTYPRESVVLMQYAALLDINQQEIYEGDVVELAGEPHGVHFEGGGFKLKHLSKPDAEPRPLDQSAVDRYKLRVVGNIYQPDLYLEP